MIAEYLFYVEILLYLAGALLYSFLTRELVRRPDVLPENRPLRLAPICLTVFYGGTLVDTLLFLMLGDLRGWLAWLGTGVDVIRGVAWLVTFPLLLHTLERIDALAPLAGEPALDPDGGRFSRQRRSGVAGRILVVVGYLPLLLFIRPLVQFAREGDPILAEAAGRFQPYLVLLGALTLLPGVWLCERLYRRVPGRRLPGFLRLLGLVFLALLALLIAGLELDPWRNEARGLARLVRTLTLGGLLLPGGLFVFYVQRYNFLRLSLSNRSLRTFVGVLLLVLLVLLVGPAATGQELAEVRQFVAWGLTLALLLGLGLPPVAEWVLERSPRLRILLGRSITPRELDRFLDSIQDLDLPEDEARRRCARQLGQWLGCEVVWLPAPQVDPELGPSRVHPLWEHFRDSGDAVMHRLSPPSRKVARILARRGLHAVFCLRVEGRAEGLLGLAASSVGGGYSDGELEAVRLVLRQLSTNLALRRSLGARLAEERRLAEQERLSLLGLVSASLAHEIKNPLSSMKTLAQTLREDLASVIESDRGEDGGRESLAEGIVDLDLIVEQIDRLHQTAREILGVARPAEGEGTALTELVASALYIIQAEARKRGVGLDGTGVEEVGWVPGSPPCWQTVVFNLVLNAVEHAPAGGEVRVRLQRRGGAVELVTENPGDPLSPEEAERIFEPFVSDGGTGLGLALVDRRVRDVGGAVTVESSGGKVLFRVSVAVPGAPESEGEKTRNAARNSIQPPESIEEV